jgi:hypothetical protein
MRLDANFSPLVPGSGKDGCSLRGVQRRHRTPLLASRYSRLALLAKTVSFATPRPEILFGASD